MNFLRPEAAVSICINGMVTFHKDLDNYLLIKDFSESMQDDIRHYIEDFCESERIDYSSSVEYDLHGQRNSVTEYVFDVIEFNAALENKFNVV